MYSEVHTNRVLYRTKPDGQREFRQIAVVEHEQFEVRIFHGDVVQTDPQFIAEIPDAEFYFHDTLKDALADAEKEFTESVRNGWTPYQPF